jgi:hypothetical protein
MSMKNSNDTIGNRTQSTALPRTTMKALWSFETSVTTRLTTQHYVTEDLNPLVSICLRRSPRTRGEATCLSAAFRSELASKCAALSQSPICGWHCNITCLGHCARDVAKGRADSADVSFQIRTADLQDTCYLHVALFTARATQTHSATVADAPFESAWDLLLCEQCHVCKNLNICNHSNTYKNS